VPGDAPHCNTLESFKTTIYGRRPTAPRDVSATLLDEYEPRTGVCRQQWRLELALETQVHRSVVMVDRPAAARPRGVFLGLNFRGNHACDADPRIIDPSLRDDVGEIFYEGLREPIDLPVRRGSTAHRWPLASIVQRGYAVVTACYLQLGPDSPAFLSEGIFPMLQPDRAPADEGHDYGAIAVWAWYLSRIVDAIHEGHIGGFEESPIAAVGHSRLGKTALWAAALDRRFAAAIGNNSGCMGAALSRAVGETPELLARVRPYWFASRFAQDLLNGGRLPVDQPELLRLIAPRPLYIASASEDDPADPEGEFLSLQTASRRWNPTGNPWEMQFPKPGETRWHPRLPLGYHLRRGDHDMLAWDWERWLEFADRWLTSAGDTPSGADE